MKMKRSIFRLLVLSIAAVLASCSAFGTRGDTGTVTVTLGGKAGAKALGDTRPDFVPGFPVFTSATLTVSGPDMADVSTTVTLSSSTPETFTLSLDVPAGSDRVVEIYSPVDWDATAAYYTLQGYPDYEYPTFVKAYGGRAVVSVSAAGSTTVAISLEAVETKIVLPYPTFDGAIDFADSISSGVDSGLQFFTSFSVGDYFGFDRYGQLLMTQGTGSEVRMYHSPGGTYETATFGRSGGSFFQCPFAYSKAGNCLYLADGATLYYVDLMNDSTSNSVSLPGSVSFDSMTAVAVDPDGYVYVAGCYYYGESEEERGILVKLAVDIDNDYISSLVASATYESLDLASGTYGNLTVTDMQIKGGKLYIAAGEHADYLHHGKIVEARLSNLSKQREIGWSSTTPTSPDSQFYGPTRFLALAPRKLFVSDEGYSDGNLDRVVEVDLDAWAFGDIGLEGQVSFFNSYNY